MFLKMSIEGCLNPLLHMMSRVARFWVVIVAFVSVECNWSKGRMNYLPTDVDYIIVYFFTRVHQLSVLA